MNNTKSEPMSYLKADIFLLITALLWGLNYVAQRKAMEFMGPFTYNALCFSLAALAITPLAIHQKYKHKTEHPQTKSIKSFILPGLATGLVLFGGASLQQVGIVGTTAGKTGFISGLYVIIVPLMAFALGQRTHIGNWIGATLAVVGLYLFSFQADGAVSRYDLIVLAGTFLWAAHVLLVGRFSEKVGALRLTITQFLFCSFLSWIIALSVEKITVESIMAVFWILLYGGFFSVGLSFTLQMYAQQSADSSHAAIIMSLEGAFAGLGGWLLLGELLNRREIMGVLFMLAGMIISQLITGNHVIRKHYVLPG